MASIARSETGSIGLVQYAQDQYADGTLLMEDGQGLVTRSGGDLRFSATFRRADTEPAMTVATANPAFGPQAVGTMSNRKTVTITNTSRDPRSVTDVSFAGANPGDFVLSDTTCQARLMEGESCTLQIRFAPELTETPGTVDRPERSPYGAARAPSSRSGWPTAPSDRSPVPRLDFASRLAYGPGRAS